MQPNVLAELQAAIRAEVETDPTERGYAGKTFEQIADLLNASVVESTQPVYRDVLISDVEGYMAARLLIVGLQDWIDSASAGPARQVARQLMQIIEGGRLRVFVTSDSARRANVMALFSTLVAVNAGGITQTHYDEIEAMTTSSETQVVEQTPRWSLLIEGLADAPNAADASLVEAALA
jgi:hypothetical protein